MMDLGTMFDYVSDSEEYAQQPHVAANLDRSYELLEQIESQLGEEANAGVYDHIVELMSMMERQGFISGYRLATTVQVQGMVRA